MDTLRIPTVTGIDVELRVAGVGGRSYAFVIDWHIRALLALGWMFAAVLFLRPSANATSSGGTWVVLGVPAALLYSLYHPVLEIAMRGRTPGKRIAGVRIVSRDGATPSAAQILVRNLFRPIDSLPFAYCVGLATAMLTRPSVRIGDIAAGTLLVYDEDRGAALDDAAPLRGVERLGLERASLAAELAARWRDLRPDIRVALARRLLANVGTPTGDASELELREKLESLLG
ncbi:MAG: RDD family protein [Gammaproteobacteria bacterium]|nr:hypothetical protein [Gammaproteobacteria bacterium]